MINFIKENQTMIYNITLIVYILIIIIYIYEFTKTRKTLKDSNEVIDDIINHLSDIYDRGSLLSDRMIIEEVKKGNIYIEGFDIEKESNKHKYLGDGKYTGKLGPNGYDLTLNPKMYVYENVTEENPLDCRKDNSLRQKEIIIPEEGYVLKPGEFYIAAVNEYTKTKKYVPALKGRSSIARLSMVVHKTAGFGDDGFEGRFTLEITVDKPLRVYPNMRICQIIYMQTIGNVINEYNGKYQNSEEAVCSRIQIDYENEGNE